jgi:hypothetical protein
LVSKGDFRWQVQGSGFRVQGSRIEGSEFKVLGSRLGELINRMENRSIKYFDFMHIANSYLREKNGRQIPKIDLMAVSAVKRAAEGEI